MPVYYTAQHRLKNLLTNDSEETLRGPEGSKDADDAFYFASQPEKIVPRLLLYRDIPKADETERKANAADPLNHYIKDTPDKHKGNDKYGIAARKAVAHLQFSRNVHEKIVWTINHGESYMHLGDPQHEIGPLSKVMDRISNTLYVFFLTKAQKRRRDELFRKMQDGMEEVFGDRIAQMIAIGGLSTTPECQGRGYASALVRIATDLADARGVANWLVSSNTANRGFYGSLGFIIAKTFYLGEEDPTWTEPPVAVDIMVREPQSANWKSAI